MMVIVMLLEVNKVVIMMVFVIAMELSMMVLLLNKLVIMMVLVIEKYVFMMVLLVNKIVIMMVLEINKNVFMMVLLVQFVAGGGFFLLLDLGPGAAACGMGIEINTGYSCYLKYSDSKNCQ